MFNDQIYTGTKQICSNTSGSDNIDGGSGNDMILGGVGWDDIDGGAGDDMIDGGAGMDTCIEGETDTECEIE
ncbi:MAG: hypothetical protein KAJ31_07685 [Deltaproteobacteria bacterium]|nr:hypothetical protein [Deltaproteobacteria bacterium]